MFSNTVYMQENTRKFCWQIILCSYYENTQSQIIFPGCTHSDYIFKVKIRAKTQPPQGKWNAKLSYIQIIIPVFKIFNIGLIYLYLFSIELNLSLVDLKITFK